MGNRSSHERRNEHERRALQRGDFDDRSPDNAGGSAPSHHGLDRPAREAPPGDRAGWATQRDHGNYGGGPWGGQFERSGREPTGPTGGDPVHEAYGWSTVNHRGPYVGKGPKGYTRPDERIKEDVSDRLSLGHLDASDIDVSVKEGEVTLSGTVPTREMKRVAEALVEHVSGVRDVINQVRVKRDDNRS